MKQLRFLARRMVVVSAWTSVFLCGAFSLRVGAADKLWDGGGGDDYWQTGLNWLDNAPPADGDRLIFTGTARLNTTNNLTLGTAFSGIEFRSPAGAFTLSGNQITLGGDVLDTQPLVTETINLPLSLSATRIFSVVADGALTINGLISGGGGVTKDGGGLLTLTATNTFTAPVTIRGGTLSVARDRALGAEPPAVDSGRIVISGGALRTTTSMSIHTNRGILLGPTTGAGTGTFDVNSGTTLTYAGVVGNNGGGSGGLTKISFGNLTLSGRNTYTGPTAVKNGTLTLDFSAAGSPPFNIVSQSSSLSMGGANSGLGAASFASLLMSGRSGGATLQSFNGSAIDIGPAIIRVNSAGTPTASMALGGLTHTPGGIVNFVLPAAGSIATTTPNTHGILGGWATVGSGGAFNNITMGTEWATVDANGNIGPYTGYRVAASGDVLHTYATADTNLRINGTSTGDIVVDADGAASLTDINTINLSETRAFSIIIGDGNTLRLGRYGSIFKSDNANNLTWALGSGTVGGGNGVQNSGILTAGGAPDSPGEIVFYMNNGTSQSQGSLNVEAQVTDNGKGAVTVVKAGPASMKLRGKNTFSGGLYLLQGRLQFAGSEIGGTPAANPDGGGTGPIYVFPGAYIFPSGAGDFGATGVAISNKFFIAGLGTQQEQVGAIRFGNGTRIAGDVSLIGDSRLGGGNAATVANTGISGKITGPFNLDIGALQTINSFISLFNSSNDWSGTTTLNARNTATANGFRNGTNEVVPNGLGKGNVVMNGNTSSGTITWDLNGFDETINGLSAIGNLAGCIIANNRTDPVTSTLVVGDNNASADFGGSIQDGTAPVALRKIGGGRQTLRGANTYTGRTTVSAGTLAISDGGSIGNSQEIVVDRATLDISGATNGFFTTGPVTINNGELVARATGSPGISRLSLTSSRVRFTTLAPGVNAIETGLLATSGQTNFIDLVSVGTITSYPVQFTLIKFGGGAIAGSGFNFALGSVPSSSTIGYISNNVANNSVDLFLLDGPKPLTWTGAGDNRWEVGGLNNWLAFGSSPISFLNADTAIFSDAAASGNVELVGLLAPTATTVSNNTVNYVFSGTGLLSGFGGLVKSGTGSLTLSNAGVSDFIGGVTVNDGTLVFAQGNSISGGLAINKGSVQVGPNGTLPAGSVINEGTLTLGQTGDVTISNPLSGAGSLIKDGAGVLTLGGNNATFTGRIRVNAGTLKAGGTTALGPEVDTTTTIASGATLDVNGSNVGQGNERVLVSGSGIGGSGAIINTGGDVFPAVNFVTLQGDTVFGGTGRWDLRSPGGSTGDPSTAQLSTSGQAYKLTKKGPNFVGLVSLDVDPALAEIDVQEGTLSAEGNITGLGDPNKALTIQPGATFNLFATANTLDKMVILKDGGRFSSSSGETSFGGPITLDSGNAEFNIGGTSLTLANVVRGSGGFIKIGSGRMDMHASNSYSGQTFITAGTLGIAGEGSISRTPLIQVSGRGILDVSQRVDSTLNLVNGQTLRGNGTVQGNIAAGTGATIEPGINVGTLAVDGTVTLGGTINAQVDAPSGGADVLRATNIVFGGTLNVLNSGGDLTGKSFKIFDAPIYSGTFAAITPINPGTNLSWDTSTLATDGTLRVKSSGPPPASTIGGVTISGGNINFSGTGGAPNQPFSVLASSDIAQPLMNWTAVATGQFDANGNFNISTAINPNTPRQFYVVRAQ